MFGAEKPNLNCKKYSEAKFKFWQTLNLFNCTRSGGGKSEIGLAGGICPKRLKIYHFGKKYPDKLLSLHMRDIKEPAGVFEAKSALAFFSRVQTVSK